MKIIDGQAIADKIHAESKKRVQELRASGVTPGLAVVLVGDNPASRSYVRAKDRMCRNLGLHSVKHELRAETTQMELEALVRELNEDKAIHGILIQSPPPPQIDERAVILCIDPRKDVDGLHPANVAKLVAGDSTGFVPCTPLGCQRLLIESGVEIQGAHVVVLGRSMLVGKPLALLLLRKGRDADATVTVVHSRSRGLEEITRSADILIAAIGQPEFVKAAMVRQGAVVIDVGINRREDASRERGYRLVGDVDFDAVSKKAAAITPVPGGVGPMTIAMLVSNTIMACARTLGSHSHAETPAL